MATAAHCGWACDPTASRQGQDGLRQPLRPGAALPAGTALTPAPRQLRRIGPAGHAALLIVGDEPSRDRWFHVSVGETRTAAGQSPLVTWRS